MTLNTSKGLPLSCVLYSLTVKPALKKHLLEEVVLQECKSILKQVVLNEEVENLWTTISCVQLKKFEFWRAPFWENFSSYLPALKTSCFMSGSILGGPSSLVPQNFVICFPLYLLIYLKNVCVSSLKG